MPTLDRRDFEAGDDLTWREVPAVEDAPPWDGEHDRGGVSVERVMRAAGAVERAMGLGAERKANKR